ncbi:hypothetical protein ABEB36_015690 [Hypothenemus hampei]|uniref:Uncharacterized protein n=1 Tax=Hypothenemus hampei TaxID=57062 RepID=A0ABD1E3L9_HYPHA
MSSKLLDIPRAGPSEGGESRTPSPVEGVCPKGYGGGSKALGKRESPLTPGKDPTSATTDGRKTESADLKEPIKGNFFSIFEEESYPETDTEADPSPVDAGQEEMIMAEDHTRSDPLEQGELRKQTPIETKAENMSADKWLQNLVQHTKSAIGSSRHQKEITILSDVMIGRSKKMGETVEPQAEPAEIDSAYIQEAQELLNKRQREDSSILLGENTKKKKKTESHKKTNPAIGFVLKNLFKGARELEEAIKKCSNPRKDLKAAVQKIINLTERLKEHEPSIIQQEDTDFYKCKI